MKNLVLSALLFAGLTQAAGCIIVADDAPSDLTGDVSVAWSLKSSDGAGNPIASNCPSGADAITIFAQRGEDVPFTDTYNCSSAASGIADRLPIGEYAVWVRITGSNGAEMYAESAAQLITVVDGGTTPVAIDVFTDRAFFQASWQLTGAATSCAQAGAGKMSILATVAGGSNAFDDDKNNCVDGEAGKTVLTTTPVPFGTYTVVVAALNNVGESLGDSAAITNRLLDYGNKYETLGGVVQVPIR